MILQLPLFAYIAKSSAIPGAKSLFTDIPIPLSVISSFRPELILLMIVFPLLRKIPALGRKHFVDFAVGRVFCEK